MTPSFDAIAIGGGLAGCAFAITMARAGRKVAVIERTRVALPKVCGDFLSAEALVLLQRLGIDPDRLGGHGITTFRMGLNDSVVDAPLGFSGLGVSRLLLDETLLSACAQAGVHVFRGQTVRAIEPTRGVVHVRTDEGRFNAACAALATGKHNLRAYPRKESGPVAYKMTFEPDENTRRVLDGDVQLVLYDGGYAGACLVEGGGMTICWLADEALMRDSDGRWQDQLAFLSQRSGPLSEALRGSKPMYARPAAIAAVPFGYKRRELIEPRFYPVGDQLAVIPPLAGDGTSIALKSGIDAAEAALSGKPAGIFQQAFLRRLRGQFGWASAVEATFGSRFGRRTAIRSVRAFPQLATWLTQRTRLSGV